MPRTCSICSRSDRQAIDEALFRNKIPLRNVSKRYEVTVSALFRHAKHSREAEQRVRNETERLAAGLPPKKQAYVRAYLEGKSKRQAALSAGYSLAMANHPEKIETADVQNVLMAFVRMAIPAERIAEVLNDGLGATKSVFLAKKGGEMEERHVPDFAERRQYAQLAAEYGAYHTAKKVEGEGSGRVILILPDAPASVPPIPERKVEMANGPILILPEQPKEDIDA